MNINKSIVAVLSVIIIVACSGGGDDPPPQKPKPQTVVMSAAGVKGPLTGTDVKIFVVDDPV